VHNVRSAGGRMTRMERGQASSVHTVFRSLSTPPTCPSVTPLRESALLRSVLSAAVTNHPNRFTFGGVIAECVKTVFAP